MTLTRQARTDAPRPEEPVGRRYVQLVLVLGALISIGPLTIDMYLPALPSLAAELDAGESQVQLTLTGMLAGLAVGQLVIGPIADAVGRRRPLVVGIVGHGLTSLLCAVAPSIELLSVVRVLQGFAGAAISVVAMAIVRDLFSGLAMARLMSRLMLVIGIAPILAPTLGGLVLQVTSWRGIFVVLAGFSVLLTVVAVVGVRETLPVERRRSARPLPTLRTYRSLLHDRTFVALVVVAGMMMSTLMAYVSGSSFVLQGVYGLSEQTFALVFGANAAGLMIAAQVNPALLRRFGAIDVLTGGVAVGLLAAAMLIVNGVTGFGGLAGVLVPLAVVVATAGLSLPNSPALAMSRHGDAAGTAAAMLGSVQFGVGAVVAPMVGLFGSDSAAPMGTVMLVVTGTALVLLLGVVRRDPSVR